MLEDISKSPLAPLWQRGGGGDFIMKKAQITFWGVRGSIASPGPKTAKYGGNTPCVEISCGNTIIICDAGTGIRPLGESLKRRFKGKRIDATILLSHLHLDHLIGLPFFEPIYKKGNRFKIISPGRTPKALKSTISRLLSPPYFPINILSVPAKLYINPPLGESVRHELSDTSPKGRFQIGNIGVETFKCNHPGGSYAYKFRFPNGKILIYTSDNEPSTTGNVKAFIKWIKGADILIHDSQYTPRQYLRKRGWGHSPFHYPVSLAAAAHVKQLYLYHYDPANDDKSLDAIDSMTKRLIKCMGFDVRVRLSREGMKISI